MSDDASFNMGLVEGINRFSSARQKAFFQEMFDHFRGKPAELLSFDDIKHRLRLHEESYRGLQDIPLDKIVGSVGRYNDFTRRFFPKKNVARDRWSRVYAATRSMVGVPPIELYKIGDVYFVRDGNHRCSVARQMGNKSIEAHVTELPTSVPLHPNMTAEELDDAAAYAAFLQETALDRTRHHHQSMQLSERWRYPELLGHIYLHKAIMDHMAEQEVRLEEAAAHWYDTVYRPAITLIRKYNMVDLLHARTEADLYLWLVDHLRELRAEFGEEAPSRKISDALVDFLAERDLPIPDDLKHENDDSVIISQTQTMKAVKLIKERAQAKTNQEAEDINPVPVDEG